MTQKKAGALTSWEPPVLEIEGTQYPLRRLGLTDIEKLTSITAQAMKYMDREAVNELAASGGGAQASPYMLASFLTNFLPYAFDEIVAFLASVIGLEPGYPEEAAAKKRKKSDVDPNEGTIRDPNVFPLGSEVELIGKLAEHQDVVRFFNRAKGLGSTLTKLFGVSEKPSIESSDDTDGQTSTSPDDD